MRILYITYVSPPYPPTNGGRQRSNLIYHALSALGEVDLVACGGNVDAESEAEMRENYGLIGIVKPMLRHEYPPWRLLRPLYPNLVLRLAHNFGRRSVAYQPDPRVQHWFDHCVDVDGYDVIVGRYLQALTKPGLLNRENIVLDVDDLDTEVYRSRLAAPDLRPWERWVIQNHIRQLEIIVPHQLQRVRRLWVASAADQSKPGLSEAAVLPNIPFSFARDAALEPLPEKASSQRILMVGSWNHRPNAEGRDYFLRNIWPRIREKVPDAMFDIIGSGLTDADQLRIAALPGVNPIGFVNDVTEFYRDCAFSVAPIYDGGGTNIKVVESLALGRTCVVTAKAHLGYEQTLLDGDALMVAEDTDAFCEKCVTLLTDERLRARLAEKGRRVVVENYTFELFRRIVRETIEDLLAAKVKQTASE